MQVIDFSLGYLGLLVRRSSSALPGKTALDRAQCLGLVVDVTPVPQPAYGGELLQCPLVLWEGSTTPVLESPGAVEPARDQYVAMRKFPA